MCTCKQKIKLSHVVKLVLLLYWLTDKYIRIVWQDIAVNNVFILYVTKRAKVKPVLNIPVCTCYQPRSKYKKCKNTFKLKLKKKTDNKSTLINTYR